MTSPSVVLAGSVSFSERTLAGLLRHGVNVVGVLGLSPTASGPVSDYADLSKLASQSGIPFVSFEKINEPRISTAVAEWGPDLLFVVGLSQLVGPDVMRIPRLGSVGFHPTPLPRGRGRAPIAWLTWDGTPGAATFFVIEEDVDSGAILVQEPFAVKPGDDAGTVIERARDAIDRALDRWLPRLIAGEWSPIAQDASSATWFGRRAREDGRIDWSLPADQIHRLILTATRPYPGAYTFLKDRRVVIWKASKDLERRHRGVPGRILALDGDRVLVQTRDDPIWLDEYEVAEIGESRTKLLRPGVKLGIAMEDEVHSLRRRVAELESLVRKLANGPVE